MTLSGNSPGESAAEVAVESGSHHRLLAKLMATVRPGFRADIVRFDPTDPVFGGPPCRVPGCRRPARSRDLCLGHHSRWREYGRPDLQEFAATTDPRFAREVLLACQVPGCRYGVNGHGLCGRHLARWRQARRPNLAGWLASPPVEDIEDPPATCPVPGCGLWRQPRWPFCRSHGRSWIYHGRPDVGDYVRRFDEPDDYATGVPAYEHIDRRGLPAHLDRWDNPAFRLITVILMRCGLRISSVLTLAYDCIARDADGAPYLRYVNTKMKREALVPIDDTIVERIGHQQQRLQQQWPNGTPILFSARRDGGQPSLPRTP